MNINEKCEKRLLGYVKSQGVSLNTALIKIAAYCSALYDMGAITMQERAELSAKYSQMATNEKF